jgi:hypothetical protein
VEGLKAVGNGRRRDRPLVQDKPSAQGQWNWGVQR